MGNYIFFKIKGNYTIINLISAFNYSIEWHFWKNRMSMMAYHRNFPNE